MSIQTLNFLSLEPSSANIIRLCTDGLDYSGGSFTISFGTEANALACATIGIVVDDVFEDIENFDTILFPGSVGNVVVGPDDTTVVLIDDLGR